MTGASLQPRDRGRYSFKTHAPPQVSLALVQPPAQGELDLGLDDNPIPGHGTAHDTAHDGPVLSAVDAVAKHPPLSVLLHQWRPDHSRPIPQAPELYKVLLVADLVDRGATTTDAIAGALNASYREANYYANAASFMKLITDSRDEGLAVFAPTSLGRALVRRDSGDKGEALAIMVNQLPTTQTLRAEGTAGLTKRLMTGSGLSEATAKRRAKAMRAWLEQVETLDELADAFDKNCAEPLAQAEMARDVAETQRRNAYARLVRDSSGQTPVRHREEKICPDCNQALPATGECGIC